MAAGGWGHFACHNGRWYGTPSVRTAGGVCIIEGVIKPPYGTASTIASATDKQREFATLPAHCRPSGLLVFSLYGEASALVEVHPSGAMVWAPGRLAGKSTPYRYQSLAGVRFTTSSGGNAVERQPIMLLRGWTRNEGTHAPPTVSVSGGLCLLQASENGGSIFRVGVFTWFR